MGHGAVELLKKAVASLEGKEKQSSTRTNTEYKIREEVIAHYGRLHEWKARAQHPSYGIIPKFHQRKGNTSSSSSSPAAASGDEIQQEEEGEEDDDQEELKRRFKAVARQRFLSAREAHLLDAEELAEVGRLLQSVHSLPVEETPPTDGIGRCNYDDLCQLREEAPQAARRYFTVQTFLKCPRDRHGRVNTADFFRHIYNSICLEKTKITLHYYDQEGRGYLRESDLENYIFDLIGSMPALQSMPETFYPFYVFTAVRRFIFFLDPKRTGRIPIEVVVTSRVMDELMDLAMSAQLPAEEGGGSGEGDLAADSSEAYLRQQRAKNWFSAENALRVYNTYLDLDEDHNGLLSKKELLNYAGSFTAVRLTPAFIERLFEENITYKLAESTTNEAEMDYKVFLDFILAMENKSTPQALKWFFRMLDVQKEGVLTVFSIRYLFREVGRRMQDFGFESPNVDDVKDEIFDMARPKDPSRITLEDFLACGVGSIIVSVLTDVNGFLLYDNRENYAQGATEEDAGGES